MNEVVSGWISLSQSQNGGRVILTNVSKSERRNTKVSESKMAVSEFQDGSIEDGCHPQVESEWMTLSQIELFGVRVLIKMTESKMAEF